MGNQIDTKALSWTMQAPMKNPPQMSTGQKAQAGCLLILLGLSLVWLLGGLYHLAQQDVFDPMTMTFRKWTPAEKAEQEKMK